jgi:hypothetical protein
MDIRENSLELRGKGHDLGVLRLYLTPSALGTAQGDRSRRFRKCYLLLRDAVPPWAGPSVAVSSRDAARNETSRTHSVVTHTYSAAIADSNASGITFAVSASDERS